MQDEAILYETLRREIGRQFFRYSLGLSPLGRIDIETDNELSPFGNAIQCNTISVNIVINMCID